MILDTARERVLFINDLAKVYDSLFRVSPKWYQIGLQLGVPVEELEKIQHKHKNEPNEGLREMLMCWLKRVGGNTEGQGHKIPSWPILLEALSRDSVGENVLAEELEAIHLQTEG